nr:hypothetical protein Q903MT_gene3498 [Picea sitchensis]
MEFNTLPCMSLGPIFYPLPNGTLHFAFHDFCSNWLALCSNQLTRVPSNQLA